LTSQAIDLINELDPDKKTYEWANKCIQSIRLYWRPLKNVTQGLDNKSIMYSMQELQNVKDSFDDEDFKKSIKFHPLPILEPLVNSIVEDTVKNPPRAELRAEDPTAINEKKEDIERLKNRQIIETDRTELQTRVGMPPYKMPYDKFKGNIEEFDEMGLDENDPDDVNFYQKNYQRLWFEIGGQSLINNVLKTNQFDKSIIRRLVKDVFWAKAVCCQAYVDQMTGEIKYKYIDPQICRGIFGQSNDGKDDVARGWEDAVTLGEYLALTGNAFTDDWDKNWKSLLWGINYCNNQKFTGFIRGGVTYDCCGDPQWMDRIGCGGIETSNMLDWSMAYMYKVFVGYIEFPTWEATSTKLVNKNDKSYLEYVPYSYELKKKKIKEGYAKESNLQQQWYCSYYLATSAASQYLYKFQKVYFQRITGANDEYSNGTLCYYQEEGKSAVEIAKTYIQTANFTFYRMLWVIYKAKPDADEYVYEELLQLAGNVQRQFSQNGTATAAAAPKMDTIMNDLIKNMREKHVRIRTYPRIDGKPVQNIYPIEKKGSGGLDPIAISMQAVTMWAEQQIAQKIGINPMRLGQNPPPRESTDSEQATINASFVTTGYMYRMIQYLKEHLAIATLNYAQDILKYKDTLPYKWIKTILGNESFEALQSLEKFSAHRMGIYVDDYNTDLDRQALKNAADISLQQKTITIIQWGIITQTNNPKLGFKILAHLELKAKKKERKQALQDHQIQDAIAKNAHAMKMEELEFDRGTKFGVAEREGQALVESAKIQAGARVEVKNLQNQAEAPKQEAKANADIQVEETKKNLEQQEPFKV
jgi:hypothetical protein